MPASSSASTRERRAATTGMRWRDRWCRRCPTCIRTRSSARSRGAPAGPRRTATTASGRGARRCTRSSIASTPTRSRRSPRRRSSRWRRPATRSVAEFHYVHHDPAGKPYADPAELAMRIVAAARTAGIAPHAAAGVLRACRIRRIARRPAGSAGSCTRPTRSRISSTACASAPRSQGYVLGVAPHSLRAVTPDELAQVVRLAGANAPDPHPCRRADARGRRMLRVERHASGRVAARAGEDRSALVHRARHAHDRARDRGARRERRGGGSRADDRSRPRRRHVSRAPRTSVRTAASASAAIRTPRSRRSPNCGSSNGRSACARAGATCWPTTAARRSARRCGSAPRPAARRRWRSRSAPSPPGCARDLVVLNEDDPALVAAGAGGRARRRDLRSGARPGARRADRAGRFVVRDGRHAQEDAVLARYRTTLAQADDESAHFDLLLIDAHLATMQPGGAPYGAMRDGAVGIRGDRIAWVGPRADLAARLHCGADAVVRRRLADCPGSSTATRISSTRAIARTNSSGGSRVRRTPTSRAKAAASPSTVRATRAASEDELAAQSAPRLAALASRRRHHRRDQVGLRPRHGERGEAAARRARARRPSSSVDVRTTLLAAHALPPEFAGRADDYIDYVCRDTIPAIAREGLADAVDAFCETIGFSRGADAARVRRARARTDCRSSCTPTSSPTSDGARSRPSSRALSADHLEHTNDAGIAAMARAGTVAVLLPGAFYALRETKLPPIAALARARGVPIAISTDCNPGTSPVDVARAHDEHGVHAVRPHAGGGAARASPSMRRARSASPTAA